MQATHLPSCWFSNVVGKQLSVIYMETILVDRWKQFMARYKNRNIGGETSLYTYTKIV